MKRLFVLAASIAIFSLTFSQASAEEKEQGKVETGIVAEKGGVLIGKGKLIFEPGLQYSHISTQRLDVTGFSVLPSLVFGVVQIEKIRRDILVSSVTLKYGIIDAIELDVKVPHLLRYDNFTFGVPADRTEKRIDNSGLGDVEGALLVHVVKETESRPDIIASVKVKSRTGKSPYNIPTETINNNTVPTDLPLGSGHWAVEPGITVVKSADPAVIFGNISYFNHFKRNVGYGFGEVDPSDSINYSLGVAYALSDKVALSSAFEQRFYKKTKINGVKQPDTDINTATLSFGTTYALHERAALSFSIGIGLTPDSPDFQVSMRLPIRIF